jgi:hypothetical protein
MARGLQAAMRMNEENSGLGYTPFKIEKDKGAEQVRILQPYDEWVSLWIHNVWEKVKPTRCGATEEQIDGEIRENRKTCPLCMMDIPRSVKTYIPVRVRGDDNSERVQIIVYGRDHLAQVSNVIDNLPEGKDITMFDFKIVRKGEKLNTTYFWNVAADADLVRPLNEAERSLVIPDMEELIVVKEEHELLRRANGFAQSESATPVEASNGNGKKTPF